MTQSIEDGYTFIKELKVPFLGLMTIKYRPAAGAARACYYNRLVSGDVAKATKIGAEIIASSLISVDSPFPYDMTAKDWEKAPSGAFEEVLGLIMSYDVEQSEADAKNSPSAQVSSS